MLGERWAKTCKSSADYPSGIAASPRCSSAPVLVSPSASSSPSSYSNDARGPHSSVSGSAQDERGKSATMCVHHFYQKKL
jgi:hypothetical protein